MSIVIKVVQNPDNSWTATGGTSFLVVSVTCLTKHKAVVGLDVAIAAINASHSPAAVCTSEEGK